MNAHPKLAELEAAFTSAIDSRDPYAALAAVRAARKAGRADVIPPEVAALVASAALDSRPTLADRASQHNSMIGDPSKRVSLAKLKAVYARGERDQAHSRMSPDVRVASFLKLLRTGRVEDARYRGDFDLLPATHPKSTTASPASFTDATSELVAELDAVRSELSLEPLIADIIIDKRGRRWDPRLHPRGRDGKFIERGGIVKVFFGNRDPRVRGVGRVVQILPNGEVLVELLSDVGDEHGNKLIGQQVPLKPKQIAQLRKGEVRLDTLRDDAGVKDADLPPQEPRAERKLPDRNGKVTGVGDRVRLPDGQEGTVVNVDNGSGRLSVRHDDDPRRVRLVASENALNLNDSAQQFDAPEGALDPKAYLGERGLQRGRWGRNRRVVVGREQVRRARARAELSDKAKLPDDPAAVPADISNRLFAFPNRPNNNDRADLGDGYYARFNADSGVWQVFNPNDEELTTAPTFTNDTALAEPRRRDRLAAELSNFIIADEVRNAIRDEDGNVRDLGELEAEADANEKERRQRRVARLPGAPVPAEPTGNEGAPGAAPAKPDRPTDSGLDQYGNAIPDGVKAAPDFDHQIPNGTVQVFFTDDDDDYVISVGPDPNGNATYVTRRANDGATVSRTHDWDSTMSAVSRDRDGAAEREQQLADAIDADNAAQARLDAHGAELEQQRADDTDRFGNTPTDGWARFPLGDPNSLDSWDVFADARGYRVTQEGSDGKLHLWGPASRDNPLGDDLGAFDDWDSLDAAHDEHAMKASVAARSDLADWARGAGFSDATVDEILNNPDAAAVRKVMYADPAYTAVLDGVADAAQADFPNADERQRLDAYSEHTEHILGARELLQNPDAPPPPDEAVEPVSDTPDTPGVGDGVDPPAFPDLMQRVLERRAQGDTKSAVAMRALLDGKLDPRDGNGAVLDRMIRAAAENSDRLTDDDKDEVHNVLNQLARDWEARDNAASSVPQVGELPAGGINVTRASQDPNQRDYVAEGDGGLGGAVSAAYSGDGSFLAEGDRDWGSDPLPGVSITDSEGNKATLEETDGGLRSWRVTSSDGTELGRVTASERSSERIESDIQRLLSGKEPTSSGEPGAQAPQAPAPSEAPTTEGGARALAGMREAIPRRIGADRARIGERNAGFAIDDALEAENRGDIAGRDGALNRAENLLRRAGLNDQADQVAAARRGEPVPAAPPTPPAPPAPRALGRDRAGNGVNVGDTVIPSRDGVEVRVIAINPDTGYVQVRLPNGRRAWRSFDRIRKVETTPPPPAAAIPDSANPDATPGDFAAWGDRASAIADVARSKPSLSQMFDPNMSNADRMAAARVAFGDGTEYGNGLTVRVQNASLLNGGLGISVRMDIVDMRTGRVVGISTRSLQRDTDGKMHVYNALMELQGRGKKRGFATAFNTSMENWYIANGVSHVNVSAALANGGFVWAYTGFDWDPGTHKATPIALLNQIRRRAVVDGDQNAIDQADALIARLNNAPMGDVNNYPTPMELATVGWTPGARSWAGQALNGTAWSGRKHLDPESRTYLQYLERKAAAREQRPLNMDPAELLRQRQAAQATPPSYVYPDAVTKLFGAEEGGRGAGIRALLDRGASLDEFDKYQFSWFQHVTRASLVDSGAYGNPRGLDSQTAAELDKLEGDLRAEDIRRYPRAQLGPEGDALAQVAYRDVMNNNVPGYSSQSLSATGESGAIGDSYRVTHTDSGRVFYVKYVEDAQNNSSEVDGANLAHALGINGAPDVRISSVDPRIVIMTSAGEDMPLSVQARRARDVSLGPSGAHWDDAPNFDYIANPEDGLIGLFHDVLTSNGDRHSGNYLLGEDEFGMMRYYPIDHGLTLRGWRADTPGLNADMVTQQGYGARNLPVARYTENLHLAMRYKRVVGADRVTLAVKRYSANLRAVIDSGELQFDTPGNKDDVLAILDVIDADPAGFVRGLS